MERVTFFNEESGFAVLWVKIRGQRDLVSVLGSLPSVSAGEWPTANGWWVRDKEHGLQFKAQVLKATPPTTSEGVERYLGGGFVKGVGPVLAKKLVEHFGAKVLGIISDNPADLESVDGIGPSAGKRSPMPGRRGCRSERSWSSSTAMGSVPGERSASTRRTGIWPSRLCGRIRIPWYLRSRRIEQLFRLAHVGKRHRASAFQALREIN